MPKWRPFKFAPSQVWDDSERLHPAAVCRAFVLGDIHGAVRHLTRALNRAIELRADVVVQAGDFLGDMESWLDCNPEESAFLWAAHDAPLPIVLVGGNLAAWPALRRFAATAGAQHGFASRRPIHLGGSLWWAWRGSVWRWGLARCGALGDAVSPDPHDPDVSRLRWSDGAALPDDLELLVANVHAEHDGRLDVLFAHDTPARAPGLDPSTSRGPLDIHAARAASRALVADAVNRTQPRLLLHRIWGDASRERISPRTEAIGLATADRKRSRALLTLGDPPRAEYP